VADRVYSSSEQILACHDAGITADVPKPMIAGAKADGHFNCMPSSKMRQKRMRLPAGEILFRRYTNIPKSLTSTVTVVLISRDAC
jgi:hypothetical protein